MTRLWYGAESVRVMRALSQTEVDEPLQARKQRHKRVRINIEINL